MRKIILIGLVLLFLVTIVSSADLISIDKPENKLICEDNFCYKERTEINFNNIADGFSFNGIEITTENSDGNTILKNKETLVTSKIQFIPKISKTSLSDSVEYKWNKKPDIIKEKNYFSNPNSFLEYMGVKNFEELAKVCTKQEGKCDHVNYKYYTFYWKEEDITLNTKKIDINTKEVYNIDLTNDLKTKDITGFKVTGLIGKTELTANDVITSGGELWINGVSNCSEFFNYINLSAPECMYLNESIDLTNLTHIDLRCKVHINATEFKCDGYSINWVQDDMSDIDEALFIHNHSRMNMSNGELKLSFKDETLAGRGFILAYDSDLVNHSQYFRDFTIRTDSKVGAIGYMNVTGDGLDFIWSSPSGGGALIGGPAVYPSVNGVDRGVFLKGDSINFPLDMTGLINGDMSEATAGGDGMCFYVWVADAVINLKGGKWVCKGNFFFGGELFTVNKFIEANFTDLDITLTGDSILASAFFSEGTVRFFNTQTYNITASETDEPITANISVYDTENNGNFPNRYYNNVTNKWNIPIEYYRFDWWALDFEYSDYTARMIIENESYFPINSSLDISHITTNGQKDMIKIPYAITFNPNSDFNLNI